MATALLDDFTRTYQEIKHEYELSLKEIYDEQHDREILAEKLKQARHVKVQRNKKLKEDFRSKLHVFSLHGDISISEKLQAEINIIEDEVPKEQQEQTLDKLIVSIDFLGEILVETDKRLRENSGGKSAPYPKQKLQELRNNVERKQRVLELMEPPSQEALQTTLMWVAEQGRQEELAILTTIKDLSPYNSQEIVDLFGYCIHRIQQRLQTEDPAVTCAVASIEGHGTEKPLRINQVYTLQAGIQGYLANAFEGNRIHIRDQQDFCKLDIVAWAEDMEIQPNWVQPYIFKQFEENDFVNFYLRPLSLGQKRIRVEYLYRRHWLGKVEFKVNVSE